MPEGYLKFRSQDREKASHCQAKVASFSKGSSRGRPTIRGEARGLRLEASKLI